MLSKLSVFLIHFYQQHISPYKGYCCAYRAHTGEDSCSQFAKVTIEENGLFSSFPLINEQFKRCSLAAEKIKEKRKKEKKHDSTSECLADTGCECGSNIIPRACSKKKSSGDSCGNSCDSNACGADSCDVIGNCHPFH